LGLSSSSVDRPLCTCSQQPTREVCQTTMKELRQRSRSWAPPSALRTALEIKNIHNRWIRARFHWIKSKVASKRRQKLVQYDSFPFHAQPSDRDHGKIIPSLPNRFQRLFNHFSAFFDIYTDRCQATKDSASAPDTCHLCG